MKIIFFLLLIIQTHIVIAAKNYTGTGEVSIVNISPEQAKLKAREQAFLDILQQVTGIEISSQQLVVNSQMASYHILQTQRARVVNSQCDYHIIPPHQNQPLTQVARCRGEVQTFGQRAPDIQGALVAMKNKKHCDFSVAEFNAANNSEPLFNSKQRFCLLLSSHEKTYAVVLGMYSEGKKIKISRILPDDETSTLILPAGKIPRLTPLSSQPLPGQKIAQEALLILVSREPLQGRALLASSAGFSSQQTTDNSVDIAQFDQALGKLNLDKINIMVLPYAVTR